MDLVILILVWCLIGGLVYLLTSKIPMPPHWATMDPTISRPLVSTATHIGTTFCVDIVVTPFAPTRCIETVVAATSAGSTPSVPSTS
jgi:hypothetical protein